MSSNQTAATAAAIIAGIDWKKLDGSSGENVLQAIQTGFHGEYAGKALTKWLASREWELEPLRLIHLGYPGWVEKRLTPGIDDEEPFTDGTLLRTETVIGQTEDFTYAVYYGNFKNQYFSLWSCIGLQTLLFYAQNPLPDFAGKRIIAWKSAVVGKHGSTYVPACSFKLEEDGSVTASDVEWLDTRYRCCPQDCTLKIHA